MIDRPDTLIIGSAARKAGKTAFAARVIHRLSLRLDVVGVKITPLSGKDAPQGRPDPIDDPNHDFDGLFRIDEEDRPSDDTDTGRMLQAGARRAFWLRFHPGGLEQAAAALWARIPTGSCIVAEGGSLRQILKPGLFILLREPGHPEMKESFRDLLPLAHRVGLFNGREWDFPPEDCRFVDGAWMIRPRASAIILAGGDSRRMGRDKALLELDGKPLITRIAGRLAELFDEIVIGANRPADYAFLGRPIIPDREPGLGPLMGIASCLDRITNDLAFVTACDIPSIDLRFVASMLEQAEGCDWVLPQSGPDAYEPLFAVYRKTAITPMLEILAGGGRSILELLDRVRVQRIPLPDSARIHNINTVEDFRALNKL
jgi:molybdopterin-guanine dinucleotide biosynthesis protein A